MNSETSPKGGERKRKDTGAGEVLRDQVPSVIIQSKSDRYWVAGLISTGKSRIRTNYSKRDDCTALEIVVTLMDPAPVEKFSSYVGVAGRLNPRSKNPKRPSWQSVVTGPRAYRVLQEILPILLGEKKKRAEKALEFFAPDGLRQGRFSDCDVWPDEELLAP